MNHIRHNSPSPIQCLWAFHILFFAYLLFRCYCYNHYKTQKYYFCYRYRYFHTTLLLNTLLQILSLSGVVELTTQLLILGNILCLPCVESIKLGWMLYPRKLLRSPILVGYHLAKPCRDCSSPTPSPRRRAAGTHLLLRPSCWIEKARTSSSWTCAELGGVVRLVLGSVGSWRCMTTSTALINASA